jgi:hypothetical protein
VNKNAIKARITQTLRRVLGVSAADANALIPPALTAGKLYEAFALSLVCDQLRMIEGCSLTLIGGTKVVLKSAPGPINSSYPHIEVRRSGVHFGDIWTDVEFTSLSCFIRNQSACPGIGEYHELDLAVVIPNCNPRPFPTEILLGVECKNTGYQKNLLREVLGVRRELSFVRHPAPTAFASWPASFVPADPPSCLVVYSSDPNVKDFSAPGTFFGIEFFYAPI